MARSSVAEARRSQLVSTYGIGALFPAEDESFMLVGLDDWDERHCPEVTQPRLARSLGVRTFRMPPSAAAEPRTSRWCASRGCTTARRAIVSTTSTSSAGGTSIDCHDCQRTLTPSRFVICCPNGHIDDFPYFAWVHRGQEFAGGQRAPTVHAHPRAELVAEGHRRLVLVRRAARARWPDRSARRPWAASSSATASARGSATAPRRTVSTSRERCSAARRTCGSPLCARPSPSRRGRRGCTRSWVSTGRWCP